MMVTSLQLWAEQKQKGHLLTSFHITDSDTVCHKSTQNLVAGLKCEKQELKEGSTQPTDPRLNNNNNKKKETL